MALIRCRECGGQLSTLASACPHCGTALPARSQDVCAEPKPRSAKWLVACGAGSIAVCVLLVSLGKSGDKTKGDGGARPSTSVSHITTTVRPQHDEVTAWVTAKNFTEESLKAPRSAQWPDSPISGGQSYRNFVKDLGDGHYRIDTWVDAQNSFGAMIRNAVHCEVKWTGGDNWSLHYLQIGDTIAYVEKEVVEDPVSAVEEPEQRTEAAVGSTDGEEKERLAEQRAKEEAERQRQEKERLAAEVERRRKEAEARALRQKERAAWGKFTLANNYVKSEARDLGIKTIKGLLEEYPGTEAARSAAGLLRKWEEGDWEIQIPDLSAIPPDDEPAVGEEEQDDQPEADWAHDADLEAKKQKAALVREAEDRTLKKNAEKWDRIMKNEQTSLKRAYDSYKYQERAFKESKKYATTETNQEFYNYRASYTRERDRREQNILNAKNSKSVQYSRIRSAARRLTREIGAGQHLQLTERQIEGILNPD